MGEGRAGRIVAKAVADGRRPHWALDCLTPNEYLVHTENMSDNATKKSEMS